MVGPQATQIVQAFRVCYQQRVDDTQLGQGTYDGKPARRLNLLKSREGFVLTELEEECIRRIAEAKSIPADSVTLDTTLEALEVDSLDRVTLSFDLEEEYRVEIPESQLHGIRTVHDVAIAVQQAVLKKQATEGTA